MADDALHTYLRAALDADTIEISTLHEGLNAMRTVTTEDDTYLLRTPNKLRATASFTDLATEYELLTTLADTPVPAPQPIAHCTDATLQDAPFILTTYRPGRTLQFGDALPPDWQTPTARTSIADQTLDTLTTIHDIPQDTIPAACPTKTPTDQVTLAEQRLEHIATVTDVTYPRLQTLADRLHDTAPPPGPTTLIHGDYRPGNLIYDGTPPTVTGVIDWETAFRGDPRTELGYLTFLWDDHPPSRPTIEDIPATYPDNDGVTTVETLHAQGFHPWTTTDDTPSRAALVDRYTATTGWAFDHHRFYRALGAFLLATVWADLRRHDNEQGTTSDWPPMIEYATRYGAAILDGDVPLRP